MVINKILLDNWMGLKVKIISAPNFNLVNKRGMIIDETTNTIKLLSKGKILVIPKKGVVLKTSTNELIDLSEAILRPEDRTKKLYKSWLRLWQKEKMFTQKED
jgi:RNase P/RNase MRP subunit p29